MALTGYDIDGTLVKGFKYTWLWKKGYLGCYVANVIRLFYRPLHRPKGKFVIISGRPKVDWYFTKLWLWMNCIDPEKVYLTGDFSDEKKIALIKKLKLVWFYENNIETAKKISRLECMSAVRLIEKEGKWQ